MNNIKKNNIKNNNVFHDLPPQEPNNTKQNTFHDLPKELNSFVGTTFPIIWKKDLPDMTFELSKNSKKTFGNIHRTKISEDRSISFMACELVIHQIQGIDKHTNSEYSDQIFTLQDTTELFCKGVISESEEFSYPKDSIDNSMAICVVYGIAITENQKYMFKEPIGFATLQFKDRLYNSWDKYESVAKPTTKPKGYLYIDIICSPYTASGVGLEIVKSLEDRELQTVMKKTFNISYQGLALQALPPAYTYFIYKCGFVRTNGNGKLYPFAILTNKDTEITTNLYDAKDIDNLTFPAIYKDETSRGRLPRMITANSKQDLLKQIEPMSIFGMDADHNGYLCSKPILSLIGGKKTTNKIYVKYCDHKRSYIVNITDKKKYINVNGQKLQLSTIRGKYKYV
jgi:hypothetical protein